MKKEIRTGAVALVIALCACTTVTRPDGSVAYETKPIGEILGLRTTSAQGDPAIVSEVADRFRAAMSLGGMSANVAAIRDCYRQALTANDDAQLERCALWDASAADMDRSYRSLMAGRIGRDPGPTLPFLAPGPFEARIEIVDRRAFGGEPGAVERWLGDAPTEVLRRVAQ